ncbi:MAG: hypothetical protein LBB14_02535 [Puniceicoccales bacterium]|jgi:hypothetical protein|nr:hypothetical protein [Puniceicoccales bacterium]
MDAPVSFNHQSFASTVHARINESNHTEDVKFEVDGKTYANLNEILGALKTLDTAKPFIEGVLNDEHIEVTNNDLIALRRELVKEFGDTGTVGKGLLQKIVDGLLWFFYVANFKRNQSLSSEVSSALGGISVDVMKVPGDGNCALTSTLCLLRNGSGTDISIEDYKAIKREGEMARSVLGGHESHGIPGIGDSGATTDDADDFIVIDPETQSQGTTAEEQVSSSGVQGERPAGQGERPAGQGGTAAPGRPRLGLSGVDSARARALGHAGENLQFSEFGYLAQLYGTDICVIDMDNGPQFAVFKPDGSCNTTANEDFAEQVRSNGGKFVVLKGNHARFATMNPGTRTN